MKIYHLAQYKGKAMGNTYNRRYFSAHFVWFHCHSKYWVLKFRCNTCETVGGVGFKRPHVFKERKNPHIDRPFYNAVYFFWGWWSSINAIIFKLCLSMTANSDRTVIQVVPVILNRQICGNLTLLFGAFLRMCKTRLGRQEWSGIDIPDRNRDIL